MIGSSIHFLCLLYLVEVWLMDVDTNLVDMGFSIPWAQYHSKGMVAWGSKYHITHPHPVKGMLQPETCNL
jgi:hypothetical protein